MRNIIDHVIMCSFCGKEPPEVDRMIAGAAAFICNECISLCAGVCAAEALAKSNEKSTLATFTELP